MTRKLVVLIAVLAVVTLGASAAFAQEKPAEAPAAQSAPTPQTAQPAPSSKTPIVVHAFTLAPTVSWPYEVKQLQNLTVAELKAKLLQFDVVAELSGTPAHSYAIDGEITGWRAGNAAKRVLVGMGSGRESADIHYWVTDETGKKVFEHKDTIRAEFWGNAYAGSVGQLAHPFSDKIAHRISDAKLK